ncbi:unnamed protein product [Sphenostylis stenocarpa]|uniref:non-specific serine/threonine protein kinase n=1 Tax=Sphenostylis stenocarpa TaxID=92480 RepID=A0AA87BCV8_9FABA|nr:unnamed protein product [Sphenostylis stenocarpa]
MSIKSNIKSLNVQHNKDEFYVTYGINDKSMISRIVMNQTDHVRKRLTWDGHMWRASSMLPSDLCDGEKNKDSFLRLSNVKAPEATISWVNASMKLGECKNKCMKNCSCTAYANAEIRKGSGCAIWVGDLLDIRIMPNAGQDLYIRLAVAETEILARFKGVKNENQQGFELPLFDFATTTYATNHFSNHNKLGEGGFGPVYRGTLPDGREIVVKRLLQKSRQGLKEFKNEVMLCAKLQHRNLVKVLGCCIQDNEKLLLYEYMANKSLDFFLFG